MAFNFEYAIWHGLLNRAAGYLRKGEVENAKKDYTAALKLALNPNWSYLCESLAWTYAVLNLNLDEALNHCDEHLSSFVQKDGFAFNSRGFIYLRMGRYEEAVDDYDRALDRPLSHDITALYGLSDIRRHYALFGRGLAKIRLGDLQGGKADIAAAEKLKRGIGIEFALYGLKADQ